MILYIFSEVNMDHKPLTGNFSEENEILNNPETEQDEPVKKTWCGYMEKGFRESRLLNSESSKPQHK